MSVGSTTAPPVELDRVTFGYPPHGAARPMLEDVSLVVEPLDFLGVIGPNGGGKTTLLKVILGLLKPQRGSVRVLGRTPRAARPRIGYVPQHTAINLSAPANVLDVVLMGRLGRSSWGFRYGRDDHAAAHAALVRTQVAHLARRGFGTLSGGQRQRVLIARALAGEAALLLLDEPTSGVDESMQSSFTDLLHELNARLPIILVSHDTAFVSAHMKHVACLNRRLTLHSATELNEEIVAAMYDGPGTVMHHHHHHHDHDHDHHDHGGRRETEP